MNHVHEVLQLMSVVTDDSRFEEAQNYVKRSGSNMCEVLDMIEKRGYDQGDESRARRDAIKMYQKGINTEDIADIIGTGIETILDWISEAGECMQ